MRLRRGRRDHEEADQDQAKILKVCIKLYAWAILIFWVAGHERYCERKELEYAGR
jgi:hypothetical protein